MCMKQGLCGYPMLEALAVSLINNDNLLCFNTWQKYVLQLGSNMQFGVASILRFPVLLFAVRQICQIVNKKNIG